MNNTYLVHHGVKGMKWGVRHDIDRNGSSETRKHYQNVMDLYSSGYKGRKLNKEYKKYEKSISKDIDKAFEASIKGEKDAGKLYDQMQAGRTMTRFLVNENFNTLAYSEVIKKNNLNPYTNFTSKIIKNDKIGGIDITLIDMATKQKGTGSFVYNPKMKKHLKQYEKSKR